MSVTRLPSLSVFLPCFNEAQSIPVLVDQLNQVLPQITDRYEIIIVNDGSRDRTIPVVEALRKHSPHLHLINHPKNLGYGAALLTGIRQSRYDWIFFTDGDGQFDVDDLHQFVTHSGEFQAIIGYRRQRADGSLRNLNARLFKLFIDIIFRVHVRDIDCAFKLFKADIIKPLPLISTGAMISAEILYRLKKKHIQFKQLPVKHLPRRYGQPTGNKLSVVIKAGYEAIRLYLDIKLTSQRS